MLAGSYFAIFGCLELYLQTVRRFELLDTILMAHITVTVSLYVWIIMATSQAALLMNAWLGEADFVILGTRIKELTLFELLVFWQNCGINPGYISVMNRILLVLVT